MPLGMELGLSLGDCVRWSLSPPFPKKGAEPPPQFSAHVYCGQTAACIKMPLTMEVGLSPGDYVLDGDPAPSSQKRGGAPNFRRTSIVVKRLHGSSDVVLDGVAAPLKGAQSSVFGSCLLWPNGSIDEDATWYGSRPRRRPHCIRRGPSSRERGTAAPLFSAHVYCGHGRPSQLLLSSCVNCQVSTMGRAAGSGNNFRRSSWV